MTNVLSPASEKFIDFLERKKKSGETYFKGRIADIVKESKIPNLNVSLATKIIREKFPNTFSYKGIKFTNLPNIEKEVIALAKKGLGPIDAYNNLLESNITREASKLDFGPIRELYKKLIKEGKIPKDVFDENPTSKYTKAESLNLDNTIRKFIKINPDITNADQIAKSIKAQNPKINTSRNYIINFFERNKKEFPNFLTTRYGEIFPDVQRLDKIVKSNLNFLTDENINITDKRNKILNEYIESSKKKPDVAAEEFVSRFRKLGNIYAGVEERYEKDKYKTIKPPKNYVDSDLHKNLIAVIGRSGQISNILMARLLGLPKKEIQLIEETSAAASGLGDFKMAGDHTDIKSLMKNFPNYKKNFTRIEYIKDSLNDFKRQYDLRILALYNQAKKGATTDTKGIPIQDAVEKIQKEFSELTGGYRLGGFDLDPQTRKITINPLTTRLGDSENPINDALAKTMNRLVIPTKIGGKGEKFSSIDNELMRAETPQERARILKENLGDPLLEKSKYIKALKRVPRLTKPITALLAGSAVVIPTIAFAGENKNYQKDFERQRTPITEVASILPTTVTSYEKPPGMDDPMSPNFVDINEARFDDFTYEPAKQPLVKNVTYDKDRNILVTAPETRASPEDVLMMLAATENKQEQEESTLGDVVKDAAMLIGGATAAFAAPDALTTIKESRGAGRGALRTAGDVALKGFYRLGSPLATAGFTLPQVLDEDTTATDIVTDPLNYLGLATMETFSKKAGAIAAPAAARASGIGSLLKNYRSFENVGEATPGKLNALFRLGLSPRVIAGASRFLGLPGLIASGAYSLYDYLSNRESE